MRVLAAFVAALLFQTAAMAADLTVFAAASLTEAVTAMAEGFEDETGIDLAVSFAGSSVLARQVRQGAPADVMISANRNWMDHLQDGNALASGTRTFIAANRLVVVAGPGARAASLAEIADDPEARVAIGDPDHVPVGLYARQALQQLGHWPRISQRIVPAGSTRSAVAFVQRGAAGYGMVYRTDALAFPELRVVQEIGPERHDPIRYEAAITFQGAALNEANARAFMQFLISPPAARTLGDYGFIPCRTPDGC